MRPGPANNFVDQAQQARPDQQQNEASFSSKASHRNQDRSGQAPQPAQEEASSSSVEPATTTSSSNAIS